MVAIEVASIHIPATRTALSPWPIRLASLLTFPFAKDHHGKDGVAPAGIQVFSANKLALTFRVGRSLGRW